MKILITGRNGFIGRNLAEKYLAAGDCEVFGIERNETKQVNNCYYIDILNKDKVESIFREHRFDIVYHFAALTAHSEIVDNKYSTLEINLEGTRNVLEAFNKYCENSLFVYSSTGKVYGLTDEMPISEHASVNPTNILGKSKYITERLIDFYVNGDNKYLIMRIFNVYGGDQRKNFIVPTIMEQLKISNSITLGNLDDKRDYIYIKDLINSIYKCVENKDLFESISYINIGSGIPCSVKDILHELEMIIGEKINVNVAVERLRNDETSIEYALIEKLKKITGWEPEFSLSDGLREICSEYKMI